MVDSPGSAPPYHEVLQNQTPINRPIKVKIDDCEDNASSVYESDGSRDSESSAEGADFDISLESVQRLIEMGFSNEAALFALNRSRNNLSAAAAYLVHNPPDTNAELAEFLRVVAKGSKQKQSVIPSREPIAYRIPDPPSTAPPLAALEVYSASAEGIDVAEALPVVGDVVFTRPRTELDPTRVSPSRQAYSRAKGLARRLGLARRVVAPASASTDEYS